MVDDKTKQIIIGLVILAIGVIIATVGTIFEGSTQTAFYVIGGFTILGGIIVFIRGVR